MAIKSEAEIYKIIENHLKASSDPLTCVALWEHDDVRQHAHSPERVSDFLGLMWRRNLIQRWNAPKTSLDRSRFAYSWIDDPEASKPRIVTEKYSGNAKRANLSVTEDDGVVTLEFDKFFVTIRHK